MGLRRDSPQTFSERIPPQPETPSMTDKAQSLVETAPITGLEITAEELQTLARKADYDPSNDRFAWRDMLKRLLRDFDRLLTHANAETKEVEFWKDVANQMEADRDAAYAEYCDKANAETARADEAEHQRDSFVETGGKMAVRAEGLEDRLERAEAALREADRILALTLEGNRTWQAARGGIVLARAALTPSPKDQA